jgi:hypothetical protein
MENATVAGMGGDGRQRKAPGLLTGKTTGDGMTDAIR